MHSRMSESGGWPCRMSRSNGSPSRMSGRGWETLQKVKEWSRSPPECLGVVGGSLRCPEVVGRPSRMNESGREAVPNVQEWS